MAQTKAKRTGRGAPHCDHCEYHGYRHDHKMIEKHSSFCAHCNQPGHHMSLCYKLKFCNLCGKAGHNPYRCWSYSTMTEWSGRAFELDRCESCLTEWKFSTHVIGRLIICSHCHQSSKDIGPQPRTELKEAKAIIEKQKMEIEELSNKISSLENKLEGSITTINELNWQLQNTVKEKEQELQNVIKLDSLCKAKEIELSKLQLIINQKDIELEQHRKTSAQPSQTVPATAQQPCSNPTPTVNQLDHMRETNYMKVMLTDLQNQQQKLFVIVNLLYNKTKAQDKSKLHYPSFNPYMGPYDTGQYFNKLQMV